jgi:hypothetical protein
VGEKFEDALELRSLFEYARGSVESDPPEARPVVVVVVNQDGRSRITAQIGETLEVARERFGFWSTAV